MAKTLTIEGSISPSVYLARGERREVRDDDPRVQRLIRGGFVNVVSESGEVEPSPLPEPAPIPARNASRDDWAEYLAAGAFGIVTEGKGRDELIAEYDKWLETHDAPAVDPETDAG